MKSKNQQRRELVEWNPDQTELVFRGTVIPLTEFWASLRGSTGMRGFLDQHSEIPAQVARDVLRLAGERFCWWPDDLDEQERARRLPDPRFEVAESDPDILGGCLCFVGTRKTLEILFENLYWDENGQGTLDDLVDWYELPKSVTARAVMIAAELFSEGLVPDEDLPGRRRAPRSGTTPQKEGT